jgi:DNA-binding PadR family transcriptional regulator
MAPEEFIILKKIFEHGYLFDNEIVPYGLSIPALNKLVKDGLVIREADRFTLSDSGKKALVD